MAYPALQGPTLLALLKDGARRMHAYIGKYDDYGGGAVGTEAILRQQIADAFADNGQEFKIEGAYTDYFSPFNTTKPGEASSTLKGRRADVVIFSTLFPLAFIETKINVPSLGKLSGDLDRLIKALSFDDIRPAGSLWGILVFEVVYTVPPEYIPPGKERRRRSYDNFLKAEDYLACMVKKEQRIESDLAIFAAANPDFSFRLEKLLDDAQSAVPREIEVMPEGEVLGRHGYAARYDAILVQSKIEPAPRKPLFPRTATAEP